MANTITSVQIDRTQKIKNAQLYVDTNLRGGLPISNIKSGLTLMDLTQEEINGMNYYLVSSTPEVAKAVATAVQQTGNTTPETVSVSAPTEKATGYIDLDLMGVQLGLTGISQDLTVSPLIGTGLTSATQTSGSVVTPYNSADMYKFKLSDAGISEAIEIAPFLKREYEFRPMYLQMVDTDKNIVGIGLSEGVVITSLKLNPNPNSINVSSAKMINRYHTMTRWVEEHWGDEIDVISANGSTYAFMAFATDGLSEAGLTVAQRDKTKAYLMLKELVKIFQTNGCLYQDSSTYEGAQFSPTTNLQVTDLTATDRFLLDPTNAYFLNKHPREGMTKERLYINLYFDYLSVTGYFESFDILQEAGSPFKFTYSFVFKAEKTKYIQGGSATASAVIPVVPVPTPTSSKVLEGVDINVQESTGIELG